MPTAPPAGNQPAHTIRKHSLKASIWRNETRNGSMYNVTLIRTYKDGEDSKDTPSLEFDDLANASKLLLDAETSVAEQDCPGQSRAGKSTRGTASGRKPTIVIYPRKEVDVSQPGVRPGFFHGWRSPASNLSPIKNRRLVKEGGTLHRGYRRRQKLTRSLSRVSTKFVPLAPYSLRRVPSGANSADDSARLRFAARCGSVT